MRAYRRDQEAIMTFVDFIKAKGVRRLAQSLETRESAIYVWANRGRIPRMVWPELLKAYPELGLNDLLAMEEAANASAETP